MSDRLIVRGAREHNLQDVSLDLPRDRLIVFTGLSGSGKSSLAFDTIYAEGQRRYVESLSAYARQFLGQMDKPDVDFIEGLSPAISIDQKSASRNPRSTVGTITEIYDYLRLLYARVGIPHCPKDGSVVSRQTPQQIVDRVLTLPEGTRFQVLAPMVRGRKGEYESLFEELAGQGYARARVDGTAYELSDVPKLARYEAHTIEVVVDRLVLRAGIERRLTDSLETALKLADGVAEVQIVPRGSSLDEGGGADDGGRHRRGGPGWRRPTGDAHFFPAPGLPGVRHLVRRAGAAQFLFQLSIWRMPPLRRPWDSLRGRPRTGGARPRPVDRRRCRGPLGRGAQRVFRALPPGCRGDLRHPDLVTLAEAQKAGPKGRAVRIGRHAGPLALQEPLRQDAFYYTTYEGVVPYLQRRHAEAESDSMREQIEGYMREVPCSECSGARLKPESLAVTVGGSNLFEVCDLSIRDSTKFVADLRLSERDHLIADRVLKEVNARLQFLVDVGLDYLSLNRNAGTLAGGEAQRIRLASQIGSGLVGVLYVLDEPSVGLHQRDNRKLIDTLVRLRDLGNTVIVVEHDEETIRTADHVVDIGAGAGEHGGQIVVSGTVKDLLRTKASLTGQYLSGKRYIPVPVQRREPRGWLSIRGAKEHNLANIDVEFPVGCLTVVSGVSGSGKSTLVNDILLRAMMQRVYKSKEVPGRHRKVEGMDAFDKVVDVDQSPIGRTPRSNPATYTGVFDHVRRLFAATTEAKVRGYQPGRFSFNVAGGRCDGCSGDGTIKIEMHFMPDIYVPCEVCKGARYNRDTLDVTFKGKNIADVLDLSCEEAAEYFSNQPVISRHMQTLVDVGLGYVRLGQPAPTLSGGEAQRIKLASELSKRSTGRTLYILDEPTTGLHFEDVRKLLGVLDRLVEQGNTVIVIEHNLDVIKTADWLVDLGPEGGDGGGKVVATGTPEDVAKCSASYTGQFLEPLLKSR